MIRFVYDRSPVFVQNMMATVSGWQKNRQRYGSDEAKKWLEFYTETAAWPEPKLRQYQFKQLKKTLELAFNHVPFYRDKYGQLGLSAEDIQTLEDLPELPVLTKEDIISSGKRLISDLYGVRDLLVFPTSGSTGTPMNLYNSRRANCRNHAYRWAQCRPGITRKDAYANFTGIEIVCPGQKRKPFWRMNYAANQRLYSVFHMSEQNLPHYIEDLESFKPAWIYGYPSAMYTLAKFILDNDIRIRHSPKAVVTSSEQCLEHYRQAIEKAFRTRIWDEYGQGEMAGLAFECPLGKLHEKIDYGVIEFVPTGEESQGLPVHEMICTSLIKDAWPLIRYRVGDLALIDPQAHCPCGRPGRVIEQIYGRTASYIETKDGARISNVSVIAKNCRNISQMQVVQNKPGQVIARVVPDSDYEQARDEPFMLKQFYKKWGDQRRIDISVEYVNKIERTRLGKFISIVNNVK